MLAHLHFGPPTGVLLDTPSGTVVLFFTGRHQMAPFHQPSMAKHVVELAREPRPRPLVLVIDPNETTRSVLEVALSRDGFDVWSASSGAKGIELVRQAPGPDVVVVEADLSSGDGLSFVAQLRSETSRTGAVEVTVVVTEDMAPGVISLPHGWGHDRDGVTMETAVAHGGVSLNDLTDELRVDTLSGTAAFSGTPVTVERVEPKAAT